MLINQDLVKKVRDYFSLNIYEAKVWMALLRKGIASAGEVAVISGVPRSRTYDVLENLDKRGFAIAKLGKPIKYIGVKPKMILEKLKNNAQKKAEDKIIELSKVKDTGEFAELESLYNTGLEPVKAEDISLALKGKANISNSIREIMRNAKNEVIICTNVEEVISKIKLFQQTFDLLKKSKVKINVNAKFFIVDRKEVMFYLSKNSDDEDIAIWLNSEFFSGAFASLFEKALKA